MEVHDNPVSIHKELLGLASSFRPSTTPFADVLLHFRDTTVGTGGREALRLNPNDLWMKIFGDGFHVIAIHRLEELFECYCFGAHSSNSSLSTPFALCDALAVNRAQSRIV
jgi:hypothetical protein